MRKTESQQNLRKHRKTYEYMFDLKHRKSLGKLKEMRENIKNRKTIGQFCW